MTPAEAMQTIEGPRFSALTNLASDFRTFLRILGDQPEVKALLAAMNSEGVTIRVFSRVLGLADCPPEGEYEHPADAAMAAYLWLLSQSNSDFVEIAAETILGCKQCWWSRKMAERVKKATRFQSRAGLVSKVLPAGDWAVDYTVHDRPDFVAVPTWTQIVGRCNRAAPAGGGVVIYPVEKADVSGFFKNHEGGRLNKAVLVGEGQ